MTPLAPNPQSYPRTPSPKSELTAAPACFEGLAQALRWLELRQMQPHSWQVFSGSSLMWRSAWYCFLHWCLPLVCGRKCPCAWQPLGLALRFATCCLDSTASLEVPLLHTKRAPQLLWLFLSYPHSPSVPSQCMQATYSISVTSPARLLLPERDIAAFGHRNMKFFLKEDYSHIPLKSNQGQKMHTGRSDLWLNF